MDSPLLSQLAPDSKVYNEPAFDYKAQWMSADRPELSGDAAWLTPGRHAVVVGGSATGLITARVLSDYFEAVTLSPPDTDLT